MLAVSRDSTLKRQLGVGSRRASLALKSKLHSVPGRLHSDADALHSGRHSNGDTRGRWTGAVTATAGAANKGQDGFDQLATNCLLAVSIVWHQVWLIVGVASAAGLAWVPSGRLGQAGAAWMMQGLDITSQRMSHTLSVTFNNPFFVLLRATQRLCHPSKSMQPLPDTLCLCHRTYSSWFPLLAFSTEVRL